MSESKWDDPMFHEGRRWGRMEKEASLISIIEAEKNIANEAKPITSGSYGYWAGLNRAIELIKGENSE